MVLSGRWSSYLANKLLSGQQKADVPMYRSGHLRIICLLSGPDIWQIDQSVRGRTLHYPSASLGSTSGKFHSEVHSAITCESLLEGQNCQLREVETGRGRLLQVQYISCQDLPKGGGGRAWPFQSLALPSSLRSIPNAFTPNLDRQPAVCTCGKYTTPASLAHIQDDNKIDL